MSLPLPEQTSAAACTTEIRPGTPGRAAEPPPTGSSPLEPQPGGGTEEKMEQSVCGVTQEANTDKIMNATIGKRKTKNPNNALYNTEKQQYHMYQKIWHNQNNSSSYRSSVSFIVRQIVLNRAESPP